MMIESVAGFISAAPTPCTTRGADQELARSARGRRRARRSVKIDEAEDEDPPPAEEVGELAAGEHQHART